MSPTNDFTLGVPLDVSSVVDSVSDDDTVKVVARTLDGTITSTTVALNADAPLAELPFPEKPGTVVVSVGSVEDDDEDIIMADTPTLTIPGRVIDRHSPITPIPIEPWFTDRIRLRCRTFRVRGRVLCPNGQPVPGATVTLFDVDRWLFWSSLQQVGTTTTNEHGYFYIEFRWCCRYLPWWHWYRNRTWSIDPVVVKAVEPVLHDKKIRLGKITPQPSLSVLEPLAKDMKLGNESLNAPLIKVAPKDLELVRKRLLDLVKPLPELRPFLPWPWHPFRPWSDCRPDLIFRVTQTCGNEEHVIVDETVSDTRYDVREGLTVTLYADDTACCLPPHPEVDCLFTDAVCGHQLAYFAGNTGAPVAPDTCDGYRVTAIGGIDQFLDIPYGGVIPIRHAPSELAGIDWYGFEFADHASAPHAESDWQPLGGDATLAITRPWLDTTPGITNPISSEKFIATPIGGYGVFESVAHYETSHDPTQWSPAGPRMWLSGKYTLLVLNSPALLNGNGVYDFRVVRFVQDANGELRRERPIIGCDQDIAGFTLAIDNRIVTAVGHDPNHACGDGAHLCTTEPDTHITSVRIDGEQVGPCGNSLGVRGDVVIDFTVSDDDKHLASFELTSHWGNNQVVNLTAQIGNPGVTFTCTDGGPAVTTYRGAVGSGGITRPHWGGGTYRLRLPAEVAFPVPCCYLLRLTASKRTLVNCISTMTNTSEMTLGVGG